jgi:hypothetical protein
MGKLLSSIIYQTVALAITCGYTPKILISEYVRSRTYFLHTLQKINSKLLALLHSESALTKTISVKQQKFISNLLKTMEGANDELPCISVRKRHSKFLH